MMNAVTSTELAQMRTDMEAWMDGSCTVHHITLTSDGAGGQTESDSTTTYNCFVVTVPYNFPSETERGERMEPSDQYYVVLPHDATVGTKDWIAYDGRHLEVRSVQKALTWDAGLLVLVQDIGS